MYSCSSFLTNKSEQTPVQISSDQRGSTVVYYLSIILTQIYFFGVYLWKKKKLRVHICIYFIGLTALPSGFTLFIMAHRTCICKIIYLQIYRFIYNHIFHSQILYIKINNILKGEACHTSHKRHFKNHCLYTSYQFISSGIVNVFSVDTNKDKDYLQNIQNTILVLKKTISQNVLLKIPIVQVFKKT